MVKKLRIEIRSDSVLIDGYVNAVGRDSRPLRGRNGERFIEQIVPGAFSKAVKRADEIKLLLNHDKNRELGTTKNNLKLFEDNIGLRAIATVTDAEVIQKAKEKKLRGWSFGFHEQRATEEDDTKTGMKRRFVEELDLVEVSIIDERKMPCYVATSIETRADGTEEVTETRGEEFTAIYAENKPVDYTSYNERIAKLERE